MEDWRLELRWGYRIEVSGGLEADINVALARWGSPSATKVHGVKG
jgi:hypothetical protein